MALVNKTDALGKLKAAGFLQKNAKVVPLSPAADESVSHKGNLGEVRLEYLEIYNKTAK